MTLQKGREWSVPLLSAKFSVGSGLVLSCLHGPHYGTALACHDGRTLQRQPGGGKASFSLYALRWMRRCSGALEGPAVNPDPVLLGRCVSNFLLPKATRWCSGGKCVHTGSRVHPHNGTNLRIRPQTTHSPQLPVYPFIIAQKSTSISKHGPGVLGGSFSNSSIHSIA